MIAMCIVQTCSRMILFQVHFVVFYFAIRLFSKSLAGVLTTTRSTSRPEPRFLSAFLSFTGTIAANISAPRNQARARCRQKSLLAKTRRIEARRTQTEFVALLHIFRVVDGVKKKLLSTPLFRNSALVCVCAGVLPPSFETWLFCGEQASKVCATLGRLLTIRNGVLGVGDLIAAHFLGFPRARSTWTQKTTNGISALKRVRRLPVQFVQSVFSTTWWN